MKVAVASSDFTTVTGHAGRARNWLLYDVAGDGTIGKPTRIELPADGVFHYAEDGRPHLLDCADVLIAQFAGDTFLANMEKRGIKAIMTAESDPETAVRACLGDSLPPPKPRPLGALLCRVVDMVSHHK